MSVEKVDEKRLKRVIGLRLVGWLGVVVGVGLLTFRMPLKAAPFGFAGLSLLFMAQTISVRGERSGCVFLTLSLLSVVAAAASIAYGIERLIF